MVLGIVFLLAGIALFAFLFVSPLWRSSKECEGVVTAVDTVKGLAEITYQKDGREKLYSAPLLFFNKMDLKLGMKVSLQITKDGGQTMIMLQPEKSGKDRPTEKRRFAMLLAAAVLILLGILKLAGIF